MMQKPKLFEDRHALFLFVLVMVILLLIRLGWEYRSYRTFVSTPFYYTYVTVVSAYTKHKDAHRYQVLRVKSDEGWEFYTTTHRRKPLSHMRLRLQIFPDEGITFWDYLGTFYIKSKIKTQQKLTEDIRDRIGRFVALQHNDAQIAAFYNAIFFATPLPKELREKIAKLGVSHLVALSGFHLSILWGLLYALLLFYYRPLQQRYFPYRYTLIDIGIVVLGLLGLYVWFVGAPPSLLRSYLMLAVGWGVVIMGLELLSFEFLFAVMLILLVLSPSLLVSLSFWLSVAGVFYIFLLLHYFGEMNRWLMLFIVVPVGIFLLMLPLTHGIFGATTPCQLLSPILSLLFVPFYPLAMLLHLAGEGALLDSWLMSLFDLGCSGFESLLPTWVVAGYLGLSVAAIRYRIAWYGVLAMALIYSLYLFVR
jgi:competence protein ComEC